MLKMPRFAYRFLRVPWRRCFDATRLEEQLLNSGKTLEQRFVIKDVLPYSAAVPGTDMGGDIFWKHADCWTYRSDEATRYTLEQEQAELARL